ncbi:hypothetical protein PIB30_020729 [Stylosanthes scabra]|uniref:Uncharacterized protein n=1 Tax=Stylosanthes scabra TaxID=79078 RepID=A0ABU6Y8W5_9FABA|nr:hypothetical protein [Stylosanthes scabra]
MAAQMASARFGALSTQQLVDGETPTNTIRAELFKPCALVVASRGIERFLIWTEIHHFLRCLGYPAGPQGYIAAVVPVVGFHVLSRLVGSPLAIVATSYVAKELAKGSDDCEHPYSITTGLLLASIPGIFAHTLLLGVSLKYFYSLVMFLRLDKSFKQLPLSIESLEIRGRQYMKFGKKGRLVLVRILSHLLVIEYGNVLDVRSGPLASAAYHKYIVTWCAYMFLADAWTSSVQAYIARSVAVGKSIGKDLILSLVVGNNAGRAIMLTSCVTLVLSLCFNRHEALGFFIHLPLHVMASTVHSIICGASSFELSTVSIIITGAYALFIMWALPLRLAACMSFVLLLEIASAPVALPVWTGMLIFSILRLLIGYDMIVMKFGKY